MKEILNTVFILAISLLLCTCSALFDSSADSHDDGQKSVKPGYAQVIIVTADYIENSVIVPDFSELKEKIESYKITVTADGDSSGKEYTASVSSPAALIEITEGKTYSIVVEGMESSSGTLKTIARGESSFSPTASLRTVTVTVSPFLNSAVNGKIDIPIDFPYGRCSYTYTVKMTGPSFLSKPVETVDCTASGVSKALSFDENTSGLYKVEIHVTNSLYPTKTMKFEYDIIVAPCLTSKWLLTAGDEKLERITFTKEDLIPVLESDYAFYVLGTGPKMLGGLTVEQAAEALGKRKAAKFDTVQAAVDAAVALDPRGTVEREIYIDGTVSQAGSAGSGYENLVTIGDGSNTPKILIKGIYSQSVFQFKPVSTEKARLFFISQGAQVTIDGISLKNGNLPDNGGAIYNGGKLTLKNVHISDCTAGSSGGAIYGDSGSELNFESGSISNCTAAASAGAYYSSDNVTSNFTNVSFSGNKAGGTGGAVFLSTDDAVKFSMKGGLFSGNSSSANGGAISVFGKKGTGTYSNVYLENVSMSGNSASVSGGAVFVNSGQYLSLIGCNIFDNSENGNINDVSSEGSVYLYGASSIGEFYLKNNPVYVSPDISRRLCATFIPEVYTTGTQIISAIDGSSLTQEIVNKFAVKDTNYFIDIDGKLATTSAGGGIVIEDCTCLFELDRDTVSAGTETTLNINATLTKALSDGTTSAETCDSGQLDWITVKLYCGSYEVTSSNVPGLSVSNGVVTIPAAMPEDSYKLYVSGIYTCPNGCQKAFSGDFPFTVE